MNADQHHVVAKSIDWSLREGILVIHPRNMEHEARVDMTHLNPIRWRSLYGSVLFHGNDDGHPGPAVDGMNEKGLNVTVMMLSRSDYGKQENKPQLNMGMWAQYLLENYQSVTEAISHLDEYQLWPESYHGDTLKFHVYLHDISGHEAIIEFFQGQPLVYQDNEIEHKVLTNNFYSDSIAQLSKYQLFGGVELLPGEYDSYSRFVRAAAFKKKLSTYQENDMIGYAFDGLAAVAKPPGERSPTQISMVFDLDQRVLYFHTINNPILQKIDLKQYDFASLESPIYLNVF